MVALQILNKILQTSDDSIIDDNMLTEEYFEECKEEFKFIREHKEKYGNVPDKETFLSKFPNFEFMEVGESDKYLVATIQEEYLYAQSVPVVQKVAELLQTDSNAAAEYLISQSKRLQPNYQIGGTDIVAGAEDRYEEYLSRKDKQKDWYFESGFPELDDIIHGIQRGEELFVIVARTNQGKSWVLAKMCTHVWQTGFNVGYLSPEMSASTIGFRFDTLSNKFSNKGLMCGADTEEYQGYIDNLKTKQNKFMVATPADFDRKITVTKLRNWVKQYKLDMIAIDGITYISDERGARNDNKTTSLTNISEDLMSLSLELHIPVLVVVQANRSGVGSADEDGTPELESIRDSDGIAHNASKVISLKQKTDGVLEIGIKKQRFGKVGDRLNYLWNIDTGEFTYLPNSGKSAKHSDRESNATKNKPKDSKNVF